MEEKKLLKRKRRASDDGNLDQLSHYCRELGDYYRKVGKPNEALQEYKEEEKINLTREDAIAVAISNRMIGEIYCDIGQFKEALAHQEKHLDIAKRERSAIEEQRALANLGRTYFCMAEAITKCKQPDYDQYLSCAKKAYIKSLGVCENIQGIGQLAQMEMRARLMMNIGLVLECQANVNRAIEYIEKAIQIAKQYELWEELYRCYSAFGMLHHRCGDSTRALRSLNLALEVAERLHGSTSLLCESLLSKADVLFSIADFAGARQALLRAYKLKTPDENDRKTIEKNLRIAATLCQTEESILLANSNDPGKLKSLYETLGDGAVAVQNFKKAIECYLKMLKCAMEAGESGRNLCPIYFSLSQTYKDDGQYTLALEYSRKDLELCRDIPHEACKTLLNIAELLELNKSPYVEVIGAYSRAEEMAELAQDWKLLVTTLRCLQTYQSNFGLEDCAENTGKRCEEVCQTHGILSSSEDEEESNGDVQGIGDHIDLDELLESSCGEEVGGDIPADRRRRKGVCKGIAVRRNEKGETALHRACIAGNLTLVRNLLDRGHPLNLRDHCGWTALHEACNHGHEEIVSLLIERGAALNDRGGTHCGGVTPIHDAASCGHLSIVKILLSARASVLVRTDKGETPLDCLRQWYNRVEGEIDTSTKEEYLTVEEEIRKNLEKVGEPKSEIFKRRDEKVAEIRRERRLPTEKFRGVEDDGALALNRGNDVSERSKKSHRMTAKNRTYWSSSSEDEQNISANSLDSPDEFDDFNEPPLDITPFKSDSVGPKNFNQTNGRKESSATDYAKTIASLKNRQSLMSLSCKRVCTVSPPNSRSPHLLPGEVDLDSWLEDDVGKARAPKRMRKQDQWDSDSCPSVVQDAVPLESTGPEVTEPSIEEFSSPVNRLDLTSVSPKAPHPTSNALSQQPGASEDSHLSLLLVKVQVEDTLLLVPVPQAIETFDWLAKEVVRRYFEFKGVSLELTLHTKDGALLSKNDPISLLSSIDSANRTVFAKVTSLTLPPVAESYANACSASHVGVNKMVEQSLEVCLATHSLCLDDMCLKPKELNPVLQAISHHYVAIRGISLSSNDIGDKGLKLLCEGLACMKNLVTLDLSCNDITAIGMCDFASVFTSQSGIQLPLQLLQELNLSHNPLGDASFQHLVSIINNLPSLISLSLCNCNLSTSGVIKSYDSTQLCLDSVENLDISMNFLGGEGVATFLGRLQTHKVKVLNVGRTLKRSPTGSGNSIPRKIAREVALFLNPLDELNKPCNLVHLDLSQNQVTDSDLYEIMRGLKHSNLLESLSLECNPDLTSLSLRRLLQQGSWPSLRLNLSGCPKLLMYIENDSSVADWIRSSSYDWWLPSEVVLSVGSGISGDSVDKLIKMWTKALGSSASVEKQLYGCLKLGVKHSITV